MNPQQIELVRDTFVHVLFDPERAARLFYGRLFELAPETRALFQNDMDEQGRKLVASLATIITGLTRFDAMLPGIRALAIRHVGYGVHDRHYDSAGIALLHMVAKIAGPKFDSQAEAAWGEAYSLIAGTMIEATRKAA